MPHAFIVRLIQVIVRLVQHRQLIILVSVIVAGPSSTVGLVVIFSQLTLLVIHLNRPVVLFVIFYFVARD